MYSGFTVIRFKPISSSLEYKTLFKKISIITNNYEIFEIFKESYTTSKRYHMDAHFYTIV